MRQGGRLKDDLKYILVLAVILHYYNLLSTFFLVESHIRNALIGFCHAANEETAYASWMALMPAWFVLLIIIHAFYLYQRIPSLLTGNWNLFNGLLPRWESCAKTKVVSNYRFSFPPSFGMKSSAMLGVMFMPSCTGNDPITVDKSSPLPLCTMALLSTLGCLSIFKAFVLIFSTLTASHPTDLTEASFLQCLQ